MAVVDKVTSDCVTTISSSISISHADDGILSAPVWNHLLTKTQIDQIEAIQRRAVRIIYSYTSDMLYISTLYCAAIPTLAD